VDGSGENRVRGGHLARRGDTVRFQVADIFLPTPDELPKALTTAPELEGTVRDFSDSGPQPRVFAVVEVITRYSLVVPVERLQVLKSTEPANGP
jgi:hypothetical protein